MPTVYNKKSTGLASKRIPQKYAVVVDAGSSGSRVQVFSWRNPETILPAQGTTNSTVLNSVPKITQDPKYNLKIYPGISKYSGKKLHKLWSHHIEKLVKHAEKGVPKESRSETPVFLLATAGMRLLPMEDQQQILSESCRLLQENTRFYLPDCASHVSIIDGETEALYGWISANYLLGTFDSHGEEHSNELSLKLQETQQRASYGFMDMGGASMQIAFSPNASESERHLDDLYRVRLRNINGQNQEWKVFVSSWLGFGANEAKRRYSESLLLFNKIIGNTEKLLQDPCLPKAAGRDEEFNGYKVDYVGTGNFSQCLEAMQPLLRKDMPCKDEPCLFNGMHVPAIDFNTDKFVGVSEYWYTANDIFKLGGHYDFETFSQHVNEYCGSSWEDIMNSKKTGIKYKDVSDSMLKSACFKASWVINVLHSGFGLPVSGNEHYGLGSYMKPSTFDALSKRELKDLVTPFSSVSSIKGTELSWMLGRAVLYASSQVSPSSSNLPDVGYLPADMSEHHYVLGGEIPGVSPPILSSNSSTTLDVQFNMLFFVFFLLSGLSYLFFRIKRGHWITSKIRFAGSPKALSRVYRWARGYNGSDGYQRVLDEETLSPPVIASSPAAFYAPLAVSAKSTSMLDLNKFSPYQTEDFINRAPSRPSSRKTLRSTNSALDLSMDQDLNLPKSGSRLFHTQSIERLPRT